MIDDQTFLGIPMARRKNRRWLVAITYALVLACETAGPTLALEGWTSRGWALAWSQLAMISLLVPWIIFGRRITTRMWGMFGHRIPDLGLSPSAAERTEPDERESMVRDAAYRKAYWIVANCVPLFALFVMGMGPLASTPKPVIFFLFVLLLIMIYTLPQAIILWTEPDVKEDGARALPS